MNDMTKQDFEHFWKDASKKTIVNQFYYDYLFSSEMQKQICEALEELYELKKQENLSRNDLQKLEAILERKIII